MDNQSSTTVVMDNVTDTSVYPEIIKESIQLIPCPSYIEDYLVCQKLCWYVNKTLTECNITAQVEQNAEYIRNLQFEKVVTYIVPMLFGIIVLLGLVGNILVITVVWLNKQMQNTTNILIVSLAFADLLFIVFCVPFTGTSYATTEYIFGNVWCKIVSYFIYVCAYASVWTLVLMSFDRYLAVVHPITSMRIRNRRNTYILLFVIWSVIVVGNIPILLQYDVAEYVFIIQHRSACVDIPGAHDRKVNQVFYSCFLAFGYLVPLALICLLYGFLLKRLLYGVVPGGSQRAESIRSKKRVTRMVIIVVVIFAFCWLPIQLILVIQSFVVYEPSVPTFSLTVSANCLAYMNSCVNPILYAFLSENFRRSFRRLLCCVSEPYSKFEYERTNIRGIEKDTKESLLNNTSKTNGEATKDKNCNSENVLQMKTLNSIQSRDPETGM